MLASLFILWDVMVCSFHCINKNEIPSKSHTNISFWKCKPRQIKLPLSVRQNNMDMYNYSYQTDRVVPLIKIKLILRRIHCKNPTEANGPRHWVCCCLPYDVKTVLSHDSDLFIIIISFIIFFLSEMLLGRRKLFNELTIRALVTVPGIDC